MKGYSKEDISSNLKENLIRRPGMFLGTTGSKGIINLVKGLIIDTNELSKGTKKFFHFSINDTNECELEIKTDDEIEDLILKLRKNGAYNQLPYLEILEALSTKLEIKTISTNNIILSWNLDEKMIKNSNVDYIHLCEVLLQLAYLNRNLGLLITDKRETFINQNYYEFPQGIKYLYERCKLKALGTPQFELFLDEKISNYQFQVYLGYRMDWYPSPVIMSFANEVHTICNGSLVDGIMEGVILGCRTFAKKERSKLYKIKKQKFNNGLILICAVRGNNLKYGGSFRESLIDDNIKKVVKKRMKQLTLEFITNHGEKASKFLWRFDESQLMSGIM